MKLWPNSVQKGLLLQPLPRKENPLQMAHSTASSYPAYVLPSSSCATWPLIIVFVKADITLPWSAPPLAMCR